MDPHILDGSRKWLWVDRAQMTFVKAALEVMKQRGDKHGVRKKISSAFFFWVVH